MGQRNVFRVWRATSPAVRREAFMTGIEKRPAKRMAVPAALRMLNM
jgi:hypothetical protein